MITCIHMVYTIRDRDARRVLYVSEKGEGDRDAVYVLIKTLNNLFARYQIYGKLCGTTLHYCYNFLYQTPKYKSYKMFSKHDITIISQL